MNWEVHSSLSTSLHLSDSHSGFPPPPLKCTLTAGRGKVHVGSQEMGTIWHLHIRKLWQWLLLLTDVWSQTSHTWQDIGGSVPWKPEWWEVQIPHEKAGDMSQTWARPRLLWTTHQLSNIHLMTVRVSTVLILKQLTSPFSRIHSNTVPFNNLHSGLQKSPFFLLSTALKIGVLLKRKYIFSLVISVSKTILSPAVSCWTYRKIEAAPVLFTFWTFDPNRESGRDSHTTSASTSGEHCLLACTH